jgi:hypothetical protein
LAASGTGPVRNAGNVIGTFSTGSSGVLIRNYLQVAGKSPILRFLAPIANTGPQPPVTFAAVPVTKLLPPCISPETGGGAGFFSIRREERRAAMHSRLEQIQRDLWRDILRHRIEIAKKLIDRYEVDRSPEKLRLVTLLKLDIEKTGRQLSARGHRYSAHPSMFAYRRRTGG